MKLAHHAVQKASAIKYCRVLTNITFEISLHDVPSTLVNAELRFSVIASIDIGCGNNPGWCVRDTKIEDFALLDQDVKRVHHLLDAGRPVPPMQVKQIYVVGLEFLH
jgi:hypothetical protein